MTPEQYAEQNAKGFEGDGIFKEAVQSLLMKHNISFVIETGTYKGATTAQLAQMIPVETVLTVEIDPANYMEAKINNKEFDNIVYYLGDSVHFLPLMLNVASVYGEPVLVILDAHWLHHNPLLEELDRIARTGMKPVIIVHDFKVPGHPELGYDSYGGQDYEWDWIKEGVEKIYGKDGFTYYYNSIAEGACRGVIFIEPV